MPQLPAQTRELIASGETVAGAAWKGPAQPFRARPSGVFSSKSTSAVINASLVNLFGTPKNTRIRVPEYGSRLVELVFEPNDDILIALAKSYVSDAVEEWEPRVNVLTVSVQRDSRNNPYELVITVKYVIVATNEEGQLRARVRSIGGVSTAEEIQ